MATIDSTTMGDRGRLVVPAAVRERQHWEQGTHLVFLETEDGVLVATREQMKHRVRGKLAKGPWMSDELIEERRAAAAHEDTEW